ncbi:unnamed protein product [Tetraodon nigroviridis]|uniref:(spotted green pufferfish) hypothetical protein n=1 Tax=Tetraodon nigroviridis TaxID=99883 RepID=Q4SNI1_TETNG|nr:unnamed protein product [Tetraodon nigroviridis]
MVLLLSAAPAHNAVMTCGSKVAWLAECPPQDRHPFYLQAVAQRRPSGAEPHRRPSVCTHPATFSPPRSFTTVTPAVYQRDPRAQRNFGRGQNRRQIIRVKTRSRRKIMFVPLPVPFVFQRTAPDLNAWRLKSPLALRSSSGQVPLVPKMPSCPLALADKIYGNEGVLLTFGVPLLSFRVRADESARTWGCGVEAENMSAMSHLHTHTHKHTHGSLPKGALRPFCGS